MRGGVDGRPWVRGVDASVRPGDGWVYYARRWALCRAKSGKAPGVDLHCTWPMGDEVHPAAAGPTVERLVEAIRRECGYGRWRAVETVPARAWGAGLRRAAYRPGIDGFTPDPVELVPGVVVSAPDVRDTAEWLTEWGEEVEVSINAAAGLVRAVCGWREIYFCAERADRC